MQENLVLIFLILICLGQVWAITRSRLAAAIYYCCVAPLGYFSVWQFGTWGPDRLCGMLLIAAGLLVFHRVQGAPRLSNHRLAFFLAFLTCITLIGSFFWPVDAMVGRSPVYGYLRGGIQILNWLILTGAAWQVALALAQPGAFEKARRVIIVVGVLHSLYAFYQMGAYMADLPATGIRRPYSGVGAGSGGEEVAAFYFAGERIFRPGSLIGEPKGLGTISLVWIAAILSIFIERRMSIRLIIVMILSLATVFITFSTSAWAGLLVMLAVALWVARRRFVSRVPRLLAPIVLLIGGLLAVEASQFLPEEFGGISSMIKERTIEREYLSDMPEIEARVVLTEHPEMILWGAGLGGISFYIAERVGGSDVILSPNTGLLAYIADMGLIGIALLIFSVWGGLRLTLIGSRSSHESVLSLSFIGTVCLIQSFIFDAGIILFALAFLLAAEFRWRSQVCLVPSPVVTHTTHV